MSSAPGALNGKMNEPRDTQLVAGRATNRNPNQAGAAAAALNGKPNQAGASHRKAAKAAASTGDGPMTWRRNVVNRVQGNYKKVKEHQNK
jgi:hypothetical protein